MSKSIKIFDYAHECLRTAQEQREEEGWVNGSSLEQIASEAVVWFLSYEHARDTFKDDNSMVKEVS